MPYFISIIESSCFLCPRGFGQIRFVGLEVTGHCNNLINCTIEREKSIGCANSASKHGNVEKKKFESSLRGTHSRRTFIHQAKPVHLVVTDTITAALRHGRMARGITGPTICWISRRGRWERLLRFIVSILQGYEFGNRFSYLRCVSNAF